MSGDSSIDRLEAFRSLHRVHNTVLGFVALVVLATFIVNNVAAVDLPIQSLPN